MSLRIDYYYRVGSATSVEQLNKIEKELVDVFGPIPDKTKKLLLVASLKIRYKSTPVSQIDIQDSVLKIIIQPLDEEKQLAFLSRVGIYKHKTLEGVRFKEVSGGLLGVFLNSSFQLTQDTFVFRVRREQCGPTLNNGERPQGVGGMSRKALNYFL